MLCTLSAVPEEIVSLECGMREDAQACAARNIASACIRRPARECARHADMHGTAQRADQAGPCRVADEAVAGSSATARGERSDAEEVEQAFAHALVLLRLLHTRFISSQVVGGALQLAAI